MDHNILLRKFLANDFPPHVAVWSLSFLQDRRQFVKVGKISSASCRSHAGAPQGTLCGPGVFKLLINDLRFDLPYAKYVDDTTIVSVSDEPSDYSLQSASAQLCDWRDLNGMKINEKKTNGM